MGTDLRAAVATVVELEARVHHVYEPLIVPSTEDRARAEARHALANQLAERAEHWDGRADRELLSDFWRLVAALVWATTDHLRFLRQWAQVSGDVGTETLRQQRFSTENIHEAWALVLEGFYDPKAMTETVTWLLDHTRDSTRRDYRLASLTRAPRPGASMEQVLDFSAAGELAFGADTIGPTGLSAPSVGPSTGLGSWVEGDGESN